MKQTIQVEIAAPDLSVIKRGNIIRSKENPDMVGLVTHTGALVILSAKYLSLGEFFSPESFAKESNQWEVFEGKVTIEQTR